MVSDGEFCGAPTPRMPPPKKRLVLFCTLANPGFAPVWFRKIDDGRAQTVAVSCR